jgi:hypothetical protein
MLRFDELTSCILFCTNSGRPCEFSKGDFLAILLNDIMQQHLGPCHNLNFGLVTKARACKVAGKEGGLGVTSHAPGSAKSVRA